MKKIFACLALLCVLALVICACANDPQDTNNDTSDSVEVVDTNPDSDTDNGNIDTDPSNDNDDTDPPETDDPFDHETNSADPENDGNYTPEY